MQCIELKPKDRVRLSNAISMLLHQVTTMGATKVSHAKNSAENATPNRVATPPTARVEASLLLPLVDLGFEDPEEVAPVGLDVPLVEVAVLRVGALTVARAV